MLSPPAVREEFRLENYLIGRWMRNAIDEVTKRI